MIPVVCAHRRCALMAARDSLRSVGLHAAWPAAREFIARYSSVPRYYSIRRLYILHTALYRERNRRLYSLYARARESDSSRR